MPEARTIELTPEPATRESFAPYGVIPPFEGDGNPTADLVFTRDDGWVNFIGHTLTTSGTTYSAATRFLTCRNGMNRGES